MYHFRKNYYFIVFCGLAFAAVFSVIGAYIETLVSPELSQTLMENYAAEQNLWLNFKLAIPGAAVGILFGVVINFMICRAANTKIGKQIGKFISAGNPEESLFW